MIVVVEAAERSGSLITADIGITLGRDVAAVPGSPLSWRCAGTNQLLREGATFVRDAVDVLDSLADPAPVGSRGGSGRGPERAADRAAGARRAARSACRTCCARSTAARSPWTRTRGRPRRLARCSATSPSSSCSASSRAGREGATRGSAADRRDLCSRADATRPRDPGVPDDRRLGLRRRRRDPGRPQGLRRTPACTGRRAITAITAQNTVEVAAVEAVSPEMIVAQVRAVVERPRRRRREDRDARQRRERRGGRRARSTCSSPARRSSSTR